MSRLRAESRGYRRSGLLPPHRCRGVDDRRATEQPEKASLPVILEGLSPNHRKIAQKLPISQFTKNNVILVEQNVIILVDQNDERGNVQKCCCRRWYNKTTC